jgi:hypothetical protein
MIALVRASFAARTNVDPRLPAGVVHPFSERTFVPQRLTVREA